jgi:hypothetical protein
MTEHAGTEDEESLFRMRDERAVAQTVYSDIKRPGNVQLIPVPSWSTRNFNSAREDK